MEKSILDKCLEKLGKCEGNPGKILNEFYLELFNLKFEVDKLKMFLSLCKTYGGYRVLYTLLDMFSYANRPGVSINHKKSLYPLFHSFLTNSLKDELGSITNDNRKSLDKYFAEFANHKKSKSVTMAESFEEVQCGKE